MRAPAALRIRSPTTPGKAAATSAASEAATARGSLLMIFRRNDLGPALFDDGGAVPGGDDNTWLSAANPAITSTGVTAVAFSRADGTLRIPASCRTRGDCHATDASPAVGDSPAPSLSADPVAAGSMPAIPGINKEMRSAGTCVSGTTELATEVSTS